MLWSRLWRVWRPAEHIYMFSLPVLKTFLFRYGGTSTRVVMCSRRGLPVLRSGPATLEFAVCRELIVAVNLLPAF